MAEAIRTSTVAPEAFPIANLERHGVADVVRAADKASNRDGLTSVDEMEAYVRLLEQSAAKATGPIHDELTERVATARRVADWVREASGELANQPRTLQRLLATARDVIAEAQSAGGAEATESATFKERVATAVERRGLPEREARAVARLAKALTEESGSPDRSGYYESAEDHLMRVPLFADAVTQASASREARRREGVLKAGAALGVQIKASATTTSRDAILDEVLRARTEQARAVAKQAKGSTTHARVNATVVPLLTTTDEAQRRRGNQLVQGLVERNYTWSECRLTNQLAAAVDQWESWIWHGSSYNDHCMWRSEYESESGGFTRAKDKQAYAASLVQELSPDQLRQLEPGTVFALVAALTQTPGRGPLGVTPTSADAEPADEWRLTLAPASLAATERTALSRLLGALPRGMYQRTHAESGRVVLGFNALPNTP